MQAYHGGRLSAARVVNGDGKMALPWWLWTCGLEDESTRQHVGVKTAGGLDEDISVGN